MKTDFKFSNLLGTVYCQGNLLFSPDGTHLYSPVGNRVTVFDLVNNKSFTLPFAHRKNIATIGLTPKAIFYYPLTKMAKRSLRTYRGAYHYTTSPSRAE